MTFSTASSSKQEAIIITLILKFNVIEFSCFNEKADPMVDTKMIKATERVQMRSKVTIHPMLNPGGFC